MEAEGKKQFKEKWSTRSKAGKYLTKMGMENVFELSNMENIGDLVLCTVVGGSQGC